MKELNERERLTVPAGNMQKYENYKEQFKRLKKDSAITEDDQKKAEEDIQKLTDTAVKDIDKICSDKEKEILDVR